MYALSSIVFVNSTLQVADRNSHVSTVIMYSLSCVCMCTQSGMQVSPSPPLPKSTVLQNKSEAARLDSRAF